MKTSILFIIAVMSVVPGLAAETDWNAMQAAHVEKAKAFSVRFSGDTETTIPKGDAVCQMYRQQALQNKIPGGIPVTQVEAWCEKVKNGSAYAIDYGFTRVGDKQKKTVVSPAGGVKPFESVYEQILNENTVFEILHTEQLVVVTDAAESVNNANASFFPPQDLLYPLALIDSVERLQVESLNSRYAVLRWSAAEEGVTPCVVMQCLFDTEYGIPVQVILKKRFFTADTKDGVYQLYFAQLANPVRSGDTYFPTQWTVVCRNQLAEDIFAGLSPEDKARIRDTKSVGVYDEQQDFDITEFGAYETLPYITKYVLKAGQEDTTELLADASAFWPEAPEGYTYSDSRTRFKDVITAVYRDGNGDPELKKQIAGVGPHRF